MIGSELEQAIARVREALDVQGRQRKIDPVQMQRTIELWESLRPEAVEDGIDETDEVFPEQVDEAAQVAIHERSVRIGSALTEFVRGWFFDKVGQSLTQIDLDDFADVARLHYRAKIGTELGIALLKSLRIGTQGINRGVTRIDAKRFNLTLVEGSVVAEEEFSREEERARRAGWILRYVIATQIDRDIHADTLELDDDEMDYAKQIVAQLDRGECPEDDDMDLLAYLHQKCQRNNRFFGTTAGVEELWIGQTRQVLDFLRDFPTADHSALEEVEVRMVDDIRMSVTGLIDDPTLGGALHDLEGGACKICGMPDVEAADRILCDEDARKALEHVLPLGALPDLYLAKAKMLRGRIETGQHEED